MKKRRGHVTYRIIQYDPSSEKPVEVVLARFRSWKKMIQSAKRRRKSSVIAVTETRRYKTEDDFSLGRWVGSMGGPRPR